MRVRDKSKGVEEMNLSELMQPYKEVCDCCHKELTAFKSEDGKIRYRCPYCGTMTVKSYKSRNHYTKDIRRPRGM